MCKILLLFLVDHRSFKSAGLIQDSHLSTAKFGRLFQVTSELLISLRNGPNFDFLVPIRNVISQWKCLFVLVIHKSKITNC